MPERTADGIAVLTGGVARIDEAMKLLAQGKAKRAPDHRRQPHHHDRGAEAARERRRSAISPAASISTRKRATPSTTPPRPANGWRCITTLDHRGDLELSHAARAGRACPGDARRHPDPLFGRGQQRASRALVDLSRHHQVADLRISEISAGAGAARRHPARAARSPPASRRPRSRTPPSREFRPDHGALAPVQRAVLRHHDAVRGDRQPVPVDAAKLGHGGAESACALRAVPAARHRRHEDRGARARRSSPTAPASSPPSINRPGRPSPSSRSSAIRRC